ncbi:hypothetical protein PanWU01x14_368330 [Parasponia andersonii]|uniref:Uncharacterized protein n=1 Tax=Parasponia andersonii TaxID=3476 RepID=A0A2P5A515_PARAD|nr:hypothetical protein PanWU01x14_368330 [Parasponia andersonii]
MISSCRMSDTIGPIHIKERPSSEMQSRIDAEVVKLLKEAYERVKALLKKVYRRTSTCIGKCTDRVRDAQLGRDSAHPSSGRLPERQQEEQQEEGDIVLV